MNVQGRSRGNFVYMYMYVLPSVAAERRSPYSYLCSPTGLQTLMVQAGIYMYTADQSKLTRLQPLLTVVDCAGILEMSVYVYTYQLIASAIVYFSLWRLLDIPSSLLRPTVTPCA